MKRFQNRNLIFPSTNRICLLQFAVSNLSTKKFTIQNIKTSSKQYRGRLKQENRNIKYLLAKISIYIFKTFISLAKALIT